MIIGHKYKIKFTESGIYHNPVGEMFSTAVGIYNGIYKGSGLTVTVPFMSLVPYRIGIEPEFYKKKYDQYLEFNVGNDDKIKINPETIVYIEDITNPYFCEYKPMLYDISSPVDERVKFAVLDKRVSVHNMIRFSTCTSVLMRSVRFDVVDYCMIEKNKLWYGKKRWELFDRPGLVLISR